ncbi:hypothetical protein LWH48_12035 [Halomonas sp. G15]|uniref:hypothetical protein n=1 Tax=Halomonas sp. G15 TaxID=2903521 RepID=UPI001E4097F3|nr:hypothetical protein [Halomonas sp. G15]MCE0733507.1 hypothetical protein [Halomonas sp. G15]
MILLPSKDHWWAVAGIYAVAVVVCSVLAYQTQTIYWPAILPGAVGEATGGLIGATMVALLLRPFGPRGAVVGMAIGWAGFFFGMLGRYGVLG